MRGRVRMLALLDPSRQDIPEYAEYVAAVEREAQRARRRAWSCASRDDFAQSVAAYKQFDVLLVNAVFDGLNLVSKEAPYVNARDGVLVLSENAGSHEELGAWALSRQPVRRLRAGRRDPRGSDDGRRASAAAGSTRSGRTCASTTSRAWSAAQLADLDRVRSRSVNELSHVDEGGDGPHGRRRRQAALAAPCGRARRGAHGSRDGAAAARAAEGRRARDGAARRDHGREAHERAHPAVPSAAALARRGRARGRATPRSRSSRRRRRRHRPASRWRR